VDSCSKSHPPKLWTLNTSDEQTQSFELVFATLGNTNSLSLRCCMQMIKYANINPSQLFAKESQNSVQE
jgi:hypothetical protein